MISTFLPALLLLAATLWFAWRRSLTYLHLFQQEEYDGRRFLRWLVTSISFDRKLTVALLPLGLAELALAGSVRGWIFHVAAAGLFATTAAFEADPRQASKKKLALTARATRILAIGLGLTALVAIAAALVPWTLVSIVVVQVVPLSLVLANLLLAPFEQRIQKRYWTEANAKLARLKPTVIGVTGSFGKTSVKHILGHVLDMAAPTLITPGSVNTPMGVSRIIRERLDARHRYFVVEMGAYGVGSIARLCRLAPPDFGLITAIGLAHYERFKSVDTVARTKLELADAVVARNGKVVMAEQVLDTPTARAYAQAHRAALVICGAAPEAAVKITAIRQERDGIVTELLWQGRPYTLRAPLFGEHHGVNIALAFAAASLLGVDPERVVVALRSVPQISHRLEVKPQAEGWTLIDDSYNSNPVGFAGALGVMDLLRGEGGRRLLITPGMVELGAAHDLEHGRIGALAGKHVDVLLPVRPDRIASFVESFEREAGPGGKVVPCGDLDAALAWVRSNVNRNDVVLIENDLPDLYERRLRL